MGWDGEGKCIFDGVHRNVFDLNGLGNFQRERHFLPFNERLMRSLQQSSLPLPLQLLFAFDDVSSAKAMRVFYQRALFPE